MSKATLRIFKQVQKIASEVAPEILEIDKRRKTLEEKAAKDNAPDSVKRALEEVREEMKDAIAKAKSEAMGIMHGEFQDQAKLIQDLEQARKGASRSQAVQGTYDARIKMAKGRQEEIKSLAGVSSKKLTKSQRGARDRQVGEDTVQAYLDKIGVDRETLKAMRRKHEGSGARRNISKMLQEAGLDMSGGAIRNNLRNMGKKAAAEDRWSRNPIQNDMAASGLFDISGNSGGYGNIVEVMKDIKRSLGVRV